MNEAAATTLENSTDTIVDLMVDQPSTELGGKNSAPFWSRAMQSARNAAGSGYQKASTVPTSVYIALGAGVSAYAVYRKLSNKSA